MSADDGAPAPDLAEAAAPEDPSDDGTTAGSTDERVVAFAQEAMAAWKAALALIGAVRGYSAAMLDLARGELRVAQATLSRVVLGAVLLVGLALSLWASIVALIGWGLYSAIGSVGWALVALVGVQIVLVFVVRWALHRWARNLTLPATRAELASLKGRAAGQGGAEP